jgi:hypothetical protein
MRNAERLDAEFLVRRGAGGGTMEPASNEFRIPPFRVPHSPSIPNFAFRNPQSCRSASTGLVHQTEMCHISRHPQLLFYCLV